MFKPRKRHQQSYDHRLKELVRTTGNPDIVAEFGVPRSTAIGWLRGDYQPVVSGDVLDREHVELQAEVLELRRRIRKLTSIIGLLLALVRALDIRLDRRRLPQGDAKARLLRAIERAQEVLSLRGTLRILRLSPSRYHQWRRGAEQGCGLDDQTSCPRSSPTQLTAEEILTVKVMVESSEYRHVPTGRLAVLAQRLGYVFAAPTTWYKLVRERGWRRPRHRIHPVKPKTGARASAPDEMWHVDTTIIRLLDDTKVYLHAVIDNFSRKILAWRVAKQFEIVSTVAVLQEAARGAVSGEETPTLVADAGVENVNAGVDGLIDSGLLSRVLALKDVTFSNSMIEAWWRTLKHHWLYLNTLDTVASVSRLTAFYVDAHNSEIPHSAFRGQTPDEMYYGRGRDVPQQLETAKTQARATRLATNRTMSCERCWSSGAEALVAA